VTETGAQAQAGEFFDAGWVPDLSRVDLERPEDAHVGDRAATDGTNEVTQPIGPGLAHVVGFLGRRVVHNTGFQDGAWITCSRDAPSRIPGVDHVGSVSHRTGLACRSARSTCSHRSEPTRRAGRPRRAWRPRRRHHPCSRSGGGRAALHRMRKRPGCASAKLTTPTGGPRLDMAGQEGRSTALGITCQCWAIRGRACPDGGSPYRSDPALVEARLAYRGRKPASHRLRPEQRLQICRHLGCHPGRRATPSDADETERRGSGRGARPGLPRNDDPAPRLRLSARHQVRRKKQAVPASRPRRLGQGQRRVRRPRRRSPHRAPWPPKGTTHVSNGIRRGRPSK